MRRIFVPLVLAAAGLALLAAVLFVRPAGYTRLELADAEANRTLLVATLRNTEPVTLTWQNSIYRLPVVEIFYANDGVLVLDQVAFLDPGGSFRNPVTAGDVKDLYHTGGPFAASGMARPYGEIVFRIGEIGDPHLAVQDRTLALKEAVGFGGRVRLAASRATVWQVLTSRRR